MITTKQTAFGAFESDLPYLYERPLDQGTIIKVDCLQAIQCRIDETICVEFRDQLYAILAGTLPNEEYRNLFEYFYSEYPKFKHHVDSASIFKDGELNLLTTTVSPLRKIVDLEISRVLEIARLTKGVHLMTTHDYVYILYRRGDPAYKFEHMREIK